MSLDLVTIGSKRPFISKSRVLILHVGGIWSMAPNDMGSLITRGKGYVASLLQRMHDFEHETMPNFDLIEYDDLHDSSDINPSEWGRIAMDIRKHYDKYDGFLILHGTDTLVYTASALSMLLQDLTKAVVLTGGCLPLTDPTSDSTRHLTLGLLFACEPFLCEVCIFFADTLLRGNCAVQLRNDNFAYETPHYPRLAKASAVTYGFSLKREHCKKQPKRNLSVPSTNFCEQVVSLQIDVNSDFEAINGLILSMKDMQVKRVDELLAKKKIGRAEAERMLDPKIPHSLVMLETHPFTLESENLLQRLLVLGTSAGQSGVLILISALSLDGSLHWPEWKTKRQAVLLDSIVKQTPHVLLLKGVLMTRQVSLVKAMYLIGFNKFNCAQLKKLMLTDFCGEISESGKGGFHAQGGSMAQPLAHL